MSDPIIVFPEVPRYIGRLDKRTKEGKLWVYNNLIQIRTNKSFITHETAVTYLNKLNIISNIMHSKNISDHCNVELYKLFKNDKTASKRIIMKELQFLRDIKSTVIELRKHYHNDNTFKYFIAILSSICSRIKRLHDDHQMLALLYKKLQDEYLQSRGNNVPTDENAIINYHNMDDKIDKFNSIRNLTDKLIFGLYMFMNPRRIKDIILLKLVLSDQNAADMSNNYIIIEDGLMKVKYNNYKTAKTYGSQTFNVPIILYDTINDYINENGVKENQYLFKLLRSDNHWDVPKMSNKVKDIMFNVYGVHCTNRHIRQAAVSGLGDISVNERHLIATEMGHSINEQLLYAKKRR